MLIDTHCHLNMMVPKQRNALLEEEHFAPLADIVSHAHKAGVSTLINVGTTVNESLNSIKLAQLFDSVFATVGIHPCDVGNDWKVELEQLRKFVQEKEKNKIVGIGETGLDYYHQPFDKKKQHDAFKAHIELALEYELPVVIHIREAADDALRIIEEYRKELRAVNHCFMQQEYVALQLIAWNILLGIDAPITYPKNQWFRDLVQKLPLTSLILETDAPFLPPQHMRGKQNTPANTALIAEEIGFLQGKQYEEIAKTTTQSARILFKL